MKRLISASKAAVDSNKIVSYIKKQLKTIPEGVMVLDVTGKVSPDYLVIELMFDKKYRKRPLSKSFMIGEEVGFGDTLGDCREVWRTIEEDLYYIAETV